MERVDTAEEPEHRTAHVVGLNGDVGLLGISPPFAIFYENLFAVLTTLFPTPFPLPPIVYSCPSISVLPASSNPVCIFSVFFPDSVYSIDLYICVLLFYSINLYLIFCAKENNESLTLDNRHLPNLGSLST